jgi:hypothetical protein
MFKLLFSKNYVLITEKRGDLFDIYHDQHCLSCLIDRLEESYNVMIEIEEEELDQENAVDLANRIINNKN